LISNPEAKIIGGKKITKKKVGENPIKELLLTGG